MSEVSKNNLIRIGVFYDGTYFRNVSRYYDLVHERKNLFSLSGLHRFVCHYISQIDPTNLNLCKVVEAHYFGGRLSNRDIEQYKFYGERIYQDSLNAEGLQIHSAPVRIDESGQRQEEGVEVSLALCAYDVALSDRLDVVVLIASGAGYVPLVRKLHTLGIRVVLLAWDFEYQLQDKPVFSSTTSQELIDEVSYPLMMHELIDSRTNRDNLFINGLFASSDAQVATSTVEVKPTLTSNTLAQPSTNAPHPTTAVEPAEVAEEEEIKRPVFLDVKDSVPTPAVTVVGKIDLPNRNGFFSNRASQATESGENYDGEVEPDVQLGFAEGRVKLLRDGWGFIDVGSKVEDAYFYRTSLEDYDYNDLRPGDYVEMTLERNKDGKLVAKEIVVI